MRSARPVERHRADEPPLASDGGDEPALVDRRPRRSRCGRRRGSEPDDLDLDVVLVRPDERDGGERLGASPVALEEPAPDEDALLGGVRPVLEAHRLAVEERVRPAGDVARRRRSRARRRHVASHTTPSSRVSPDPSSQSVAGRTPIPTTTTSAATMVPSPSSDAFHALVAFEARRRRRRSRRSTPWSRGARRAHRRASVRGHAPSARAAPRGRVTSRPRPRHVAATSAPMNPAPTTTTRGGAQARRAARGSRRGCAARGCRRAAASRAGSAAPRRWPARTAVELDPLPVRRGGRHGRRRRAPRRAGPRRQSTPRSSSGAASAAPSAPAPTPPPGPASTAADGRRGRCGSAPTMTSRPPNPSARSSSAARSPASEAPTTTTVERSPRLSHAR